MINKKLTYFTALVFSFFLSVQLTAQTEISAKTLTTDWSLLTEQDGVQLMVRRESCKISPTQKPLDYLLVKIVNNTGSVVNSHFQIGLKYNEGCVGCEKNVETYRTVVLDPNASHECDCTFKHGEMSLLIKNPNHLDDRIFEGIELIDFKLD